MKGDKIPVCGRIMAIADVYDALISKRVYKPPFSHLKALEIISSQKGKHFDPYMAQEFLDNHNAFREIALKHVECEEERLALEIEGF